MKKPFTQYFRILASITALIAANYHYANEVGVRWHGLVWACLAALWIWSIVYDAHKGEL